MDETAEKPARLRSRGPAPRLYSPDEIADLIDVDIGLVERALEGHRSTFFPRAFKRHGQWRIPEMDARRLLGRNLEPVLSIRTFSELIDCSYHFVCREMAAGRIRWETVLDQRRIPASEYWRVRGHPRGRRSA